jgi:multidrug efflux pump subunit AcrA (membrane-fusion protein)
MKTAHYYYGMVTGLALLVLSGCEERKAIELPAVKVEITQPTNMLFRETIRIQGNVEPREYAEICARTEGTIDSMMIEEGELVHKGQELFQSDKLNLESMVKVAEQDLKVARTKVNEARSALSISEAKLAKAQTDYERSRTLLNTPAISKDAYEQRELEWKQAQLLVQQARATLTSAYVKVEQAASNLEISRKLYDDSRIKAPISGVVTHRYREAGEYARKGDPVLRVENPNDLEISLLLSSRYYSRIHPGKTLVIIHRRNGNGAKEATAVVKYRAPSIDPLSRTFEVKIAVPDGCGLVSGMLCEVDLVLEEENGTGVPTNAILVRSEERRIIFIADGTTAKEVAVVPGITTRGYTQLTSSDELPETVIVKGQSFLNNGTPVEVVNSY